MGNHLLEVRGIDVFYGDSQVIWDASFHVDEHRIVALVGANGAGKSTLLNAISNIVRPAKGEILFFGRPLARRRPEEVSAMGISHVPEGRRLFSRLSVLDNLELGAYAAPARPFLRESLEKMLALFPVLKERLGQPAGTLSGGEQQMLAIARALMARPVLLMLDEPSLGLAPMVVNRVLDAIEALNKDGATVLLVEQNVRQTLEIADYAYVLKSGMLEMEGVPRELLADDAFRHAFLGLG